MQKTCNRSNSILKFVLQKMYDCKIMKTFALFVLIIIGITQIQGNEIDKAFRAELDKNHKECFKISKLDPQVIERAKMGEFDDKNIALSEHLICMANNFGLLKDHEIQPEAARKFLKNQNREHIYEDITEKCKSAVHDDVNVFVIAFAKCAYQHAPKGTIFL